MCQGSQCRKERLWFHWVPAVVTCVFPTGSCVLTPGLQLVALLGKAVEPLGGRALLGEVGVPGPWGFRAWPYFQFLVLFPECGYNGISQFPKLGWLCHAFPATMDSPSLWNCDQDKCFLPSVAWSGHFITALRKELRKLLFNFSTWKPCSSTYSQLHYADFWEWGYILHETWEGSLKSYLLLEIGPNSIRYTFRKLE